MSKLAEYLNRHLTGNVYEQGGVCQAYATDRSILQITPKLIAVPETSEDVRRIMRFVHQLASREHLLPVTPRGAGTDTTGACLGSGLILSTERLNRIEEIDTRGRLVRVQPGVTLHTLNTALRLHGLWLPVAGNDKATIGGLIATGARDSLASRRGGIYQAVERVEVVLANGDLVELAPMHERSAELKANERSAEGVLYRQILRLLDEQADIILDRSMQPHDYAGYASITHVRDGHNFNLLPLLFGSQGTLGIITDIILHVEPLPPTPRRVLTSFHDLRTAQRFLNYVYDLEPYLLDVYDLRILEDAALHGKKSDLFTRKLGKGLAVMVGFDYHKFKNSRRMKECLAALPDNILRVEEGEDNTADFYELQNLLSSYLNDSGLRAPLLDDVFVPGAQLGDFLIGLRELENSLGQPLPLYGSFVTGSYTIRPLLDITDQKQRRIALEFIKSYSALVTNCQGSLTGNSPEGRVKAIISMKKMPVGERQVYAAIKEAFDPQGILNPHVKLGANTTDTLRHLRTTPASGIITL